MDFRIARTANELAQMLPQERAAYHEAQRRQVFGDDYKTDADGLPVEQGIGSVKNQSEQHRAALARQSAAKRA